VGPGNARAPETAAARGLRAASPKRDWDLLPGECTIKDMIHCLTRCLFTGELKALRSGRVNLHSICCTQKIRRSGGVTWNLRKLSGSECHLIPVGLLVTGSDDFGTKSMGTVDFSTQTVSWIRFCVFIAATMVSEYCARRDGVQILPAATDRGLADEFSQKPLESPRCCSLPDLAPVLRG